MGGWLSVSDLLEREREEKERERVKERKRERERRKSLRLIYIVRKNNMMML